MAIKNKNNSTKNLLPKSIIDAFASASEPKKSLIIGKHDSPGAKDGKSMTNVLFFFESLTFAIFNIRGVIVNMIILKNKAINGYKRKLELISKLIIEINIVAGRAMFNIYILRPVLKDCFLNLCFKIIPRPIRRKKTKISGANVDIHSNQGLIKSI